MAQDFKCMH